MNVTRHVRAVDFDSGINYVWLVVRLIFLGLAACRLPAASAAPAGADYFVSSSGGNDRADGRTEQTAWQSLARINAANLQPGDRVLFRRGDLWRGQLVPRSGADGQPVTYAAYGSGDKPVLQGSVARNAAGDWVQSDKNIWSTVPPFFREGAVRDELSRIKWSLHTESGAVASLTVPDGAPAAYHLICHRAGTRPNHIQLIIAPLPVNAGERLALHFRARGSQPVTLSPAGVIKAAAPYTPYGHDIGVAPSIGTEWRDLTVYLQIDRTAADARINFSLGTLLPAGSELWFQPGKVCEVPGSPQQPLDVDVGNLIFDQGRSCGVKKWRRDDLQHNGDYFYDQAARKVWLYADAPPAMQHKSIELALSKHIIDEGGCRNVVYEDLHLRYGAAHGIGGGNTSFITVRRCDIEFIGGGHQLTRPDGKPVRYGNGIEFWAAAQHNTVEQCRIWEVYDAALTNQGKDPKSEQVDLCYRDNVIWNSEYSFEYWNRPAEARTRNVVFEHNTCVDAGFGWGHGQRPDPNGRHLMFYNNEADTQGVVVRNNVFCNGTESDLRMENNWGSGLTLDRNLWFQKTGPLFSFLRQDYSPEQVAAFRATTKQDLNSLVAEPRFRDAARHDYRLAADSPGLKWTADGAPCGARFSVAGK
ncbi:MAG: hypothetical protein WCH99_02920 [Verrucomicrobiota bacterium]